MNRNTMNSTHIGAASIMLIFMVLSLVSFAALTVVNSRADYNLSDKMAKRSEAYYRACHEANAFIAETASLLEKANKESDTPENYTSKLEKTDFNQSFYLSEYQTLDVSIKAIDPAFPDYDLYKVTKYKVTTHDEDIELDETLPVLK